MNESTYYSCLDRNLSQDWVTPEYWTVRSQLKPLGVATGTTMLIFFVIGLPSNILIIISIMLQKLYRQPTYTLLLSLACADLLMCLLVIPLISIAGFAGEFVLGYSDHTRCKVCQTGVSLVALVVFSLHILGLISLDRFVFVKYPLRYSKIVTQKAVLAAIIGISILSITLAVLPLFGFGDIYFDHTTFSCSPRFDYKTEVTKNIHYLVFLAVEGLLPLTVLFVTNIWVLCIAQRNIKEIYNTNKSFQDASQRKEYQQNLKKRLNQQKFRKELRLLRMFGVLFISHVAVWIPIIIRTIEALSLNSDNFALWSDFIVITSITSVSVLHPLIEACFLPEIRKHFSILCTKCRKNNQFPNAGKQKSTCSDIISAALLPKADSNQTNNS